MKIDVNRLCRLAGLEKRHSSNVIKESMQYESDHDQTDEGDLYEEDQTDEGDLYEEEFVSEDQYDLDEEMIEVDEKMLVQELRRAKKLMQESTRLKTRKLNESKLKNRRSRKKNANNLLENELKQIIESEVANVMKDLNLTGGWVYGNNKPKRSKRGYTHQGSFLKGIGFK